MNKPLNILCSLFCIACVLCAPFLADAIALGEQELGTFPDQFRGGMVNGVVPSISSTVRTPFEMTGWRRAPIVLSTPGATRDENEMLAADDSRTRYVPPFITADALRVRRGRHIELQWDTGGRNECYIAGSHGYSYPTQRSPFIQFFIGGASYVSHSGTVRTQLLEETTYTLTCLDQRARDTHAVTIHMLPTEL